MRGSSEFMRGVCLRYKVAEVISSGFERYEE
jgi:hypothetical protein